MQIVLFAIRFLKKVTVLFNIKVDGIRDFIHKAINPNVNVIPRLKFELTFNDVIFRDAYHYVTWSPCICIVLYFSLSSSVYFLSFSCHFVRVLFFSFFIYLFMYSSVFVFIPFLSLIVLIFFFAVYF